MIDALIEMNTTLSRNCAYLSQVAQALQIHLKDVYKSKTHDGATSEKGVLVGHQPSIHSNPTIHSASSGMQQQTPTPTMQMPQPQMQAPHQHQPQSQIVQSSPQPPMTQLQPMQPTMTQVSHRSQPTLVSIQRPQQQIIQPVQQSPFQVVSQQNHLQQNHLRTRTAMTAMHQPQRTMTYVQQVQPQPRMVRPATITTAQHRTQLTAGVPTLIQQPIPQNIVYQRPPQITRVV